MRKKGILKYTIGGCVIVIAIFLVVSLVGYTNKGRNVLTPVVEEPKEEISKEPTSTPTEEPKEEITQDETAGWKTYRNGEYGFEIDYPTVGWEFEERSPTGPLVFILCTQKEEFCIFGTMEYLYSECFDYNWEEIINNVKDCFMDLIHDISSTKEIVTNSGARGHRVKGRTELREIEGVFFPIPVTVKLASADFRPFLFLKYYSDSDYSPEQTKIFEQVISSFRFIEK